MRNVGYKIDYSGLSSPITRSHFHDAPFGTSGAVVKDFGVEPSPNIGTWRFDDANQPLTDALAQELLNGNIYASFHTVNFPSSEIRGQFIADRTSVPEKEPSLGVYLLALGACGAVSQLKNQKNSQKLVNRDSPTVAKTAG